MRLLKIGSLNIPKNRWLDALEVFDKIYVLCYLNEKEIIDDNIIYLKFGSGGKPKKIVNFFLLRMIKFFNTRNEGLLKVFIFFLRIFNLNIFKRIQSIDFDCVHSSYNDFDDSGLLTLLSYPYIKNKSITRAYKETRPKCNIIEKLNFEIANRVVFNRNENKLYFFKKYEKIDWNKKNIITGLDEDFRSEKIISNIVYDGKLSFLDKFPHVVVLSGRVMSDDHNERSGTRLNYIPLIRNFLKKGFILHLHTQKMIPDSNGINQYEKLKTQHPNSFFIEDPLDFENFPIDSYRILSRYDFGILHNIKENESVSEFDKINIPHRFYEYQNAEVLPIVRKGSTLVMEKIFNEYHCGYVYENIEELKKIDIKEFNFMKRTFKEYIEILYS
ncbi:hypothetical protein [Methanobacterium formicicum]|uniref:Uncharacterized protein n=1 Tax=Methanobacterium formicicum (strain DSM 3637 / PP1) TaxID=1204725 RepID=K2RDF5_METFP|nr:hypothetical protein [Methanobacterium formicicum]EKF86364.1 hypothetical protein A994_02738 [Methanobacterium formicicum DSM 3637]